MRTKLILFLGIAFLISSSGLKTFLKEEDMNWQPYQMGDSLVFSSSKAERFTLVIDNINNSHSNFNDPLAIIPKRTEF